MSFLKNWSDKEILSLGFIKGINSARQIQIVEKFSSLDEFLKSEQLYKFSKIQSDEIFGTKNDNLDFAERQIDLCEKNKVKLISIWNEKYPDLLKQISYPPVMLFVRGELQNSDAMAIAIVGTRHRSIYGKMVTEKFSESFSRNNIIVVSGLAYGIDTDAHLSTIKSNGKTYAVIASGIDQLSPAIAIKNAEKIVESGGAIVSEYRCGVAATLGSFPQRNRIISGIAKATVIIESGIKGGSLITAKMAINENREVFAVPGNISSKTSQGTNLLIKNTAAIPALSPEQIMEDMGLNQQLFSNKKEQKIVFANAIERKIYNSLGDEPMHIDTIASVTGVEITEILVRLLEMEFKSLIRQLPGKQYVRVI